MGQNYVNSVMPLGQMRVGNLWNLFIKVVGIKTTAVAMQNALGNAVQRNTSFVAALGITVTRRPMQVQQDPSSQLLQSQVGQLSVMLFLSWKVTMVLNPSCFHIP